MQSKEPGAIDTALSPPGGEPRHPEVERLLQGVAEGILAWAGRQGLAPVPGAALELRRDLDDRLAGFAEQQRALVYELVRIGLALSAEQEVARLLEMIVREARRFTNADGGTLYIKSDNGRQLQFAIVQNDSLGVHMGGSGGPVGWPPVPLWLADGDPNHRNVSAHVALTGQSVNIPDAYEAEGFDFSGTRKFDEGTGYRSKSFLTVPLKNHEGDVIGVLQLLNAQDRQTGEVIPFGADIQPLVEALASQAAVALNKQQLIEAQRQLFESFIAMIAGAIDAKSPYTGGHCQRVPEVAIMLAHAANASNDPRFADFRLSDEEFYELRIASLLHDCGKVTTPEYVVDKATKLEIIYNRIHEVRTRFEVLKRDAQIACLEGKLAGGDPERLERELAAELARLDEEFAFVATCNEGGEFMAPDKIERLRAIAARKWLRTLDNRLGLSQDEQGRYPAEAIPLPVEESLLADRPEHLVWRTSGFLPTADDGHGFNMEVPEYAFNMGELYNLAIARGTLTAEERFKINDHAVQTILMLERLPFPKYLRKVAEYAGAHHEKLDGTGYPRGLAGEQMSIPARIMAIADIFEALTATDRPYKPAKKLSECIKIMSFMKKDRHIDPDLFELFLASGVHRQYAEKFLKPGQIDEVDIAAYLGK